MEENNKLLECDIKDNILLLKINKSYKGDIYKAVKEAWVVKLDKVEKEVVYVCAVFQNIILKTFVPTEWYSFPGSKNRYGFNGYPVDSAYYNNKDVSALVPRRWQNPVFYPKKQK